jgi:hypothetical protein
MGSDAHNTLTVAGRPHSATAMAGLTMTSPGEASIDLASVLGVARATRRARFLGEAVELEDRVEGAPPGAEIRWAMCTEATIRIDGTTAILAQRDKTLRVRFAGGDVRLEARDISAPRTAIDHPNPNTRQLLATAPANAAGGWALAVRFSRA